jgi:hypothetical protein
MDRIVFDRRFRGPPESANGGYSCGVAAGLLAEPTSVRLRRPPPLDRPLDVMRDGDRLVILDDGAPVIEARPSAPVEIEVPEPVGVDEARRASERYSGFEEHAFPSCFVCGPERRSGDGLNIFPGPVEGRSILAATWTPGADLADESGLVRSEFVWAALDCPGGWATFEFGGLSTVLGTLAAYRLGEVRAGETYVAMGWWTGSEGRKAFAGTALFTAGGDLVADASATWVAVKAD